MRRATVSPSTFILQIRGLLQRRDKIEELAKKLAAEKGDAAVYDP